MDQAPRILTYAKALADESRLRILAVLARHELNVREMTGLFGMGQSRVSRHLKILVDGGLVSPRRDGAWVFYSTVSEGPGAAFIAALAPFMGPEAGEPFQADLAAAERILAERKAASKRFFDDVAHDWDRLNLEILGDLDLAAQVAKRLDALMPAGVRTAVDMGCGTGMLLGSLLEHMNGHPGRVIGVDNAPNMLELAKKRFAPEGDRVSLRIGDLEHLPLADGEADFGVMSMVLHHLADPPAGVAEAARVITPGGALVLADLASHSSEAMRGRFGDLWLGFTKEEVERWLADAGMTPIDTALYPVNKGLSVLMATATKPKRS